MYSEWSISVSVIFLFTQDSVTVDLTYRPIGPSAFLAMLTRRNRPGYKAGKYPLKLILSLYLATDQGSNHCTLFATVKL